MEGKGRFFKILWAVIISLGVVLVIAWFAGAFHEKMAPGKVKAKDKPLAKGPFFTVTEKEVKLYETAVGSVRAVRETGLSARIMAKVEKILVKAGSRVKRGDDLILLDDKDLKSRVAQAKQAIAAAKAQSDQAGLELERSKDLYKKKILSQNDWDRLQNNAKAATASLARAQEGMKEAETYLSFSKIKAPFNGMVIDKKIDEGDMASPGRVLMTLYDPERMQLWANVRESLAMKLKPGDLIGVKISVVKGVCRGRIDEIVPAADVGSRTFLVKVSGPCPKGIYKGMYGKILLPKGSRKEIHIPATAIGRVGQLTMVLVVDNKGRTTRRFVRLGPKVNGGKILVLSGLNGGEKIAKNFLSGEKA